MDDKRYYGLLLKFRDEGIRFRPFMGRRWLILKGSILIGSLVIVWSRDPAAQRLALVVLGYAIGTIAVDVRSYFTTRRFWPFQKEVLNWDKIETLLKQTP